MPDETPPGLVIGGGSANGLGITWNLRSQGIPVYCVTSNPQELTRFSRYCSGSALIPDIERDLAVLRAFLHAFQQQHPGPSVLFPTTDTALLTLAQLRDALAPSVTFLPTRQLIETMVIKSQFYQSLRTWHVPHPRTLLPQDGDLVHLAEQLAFPVFLRPTQSQPFHAQFRQKGFLAQDAQEVARYLGRAAAYGLALMVQEIVPGPITQGYILRGYLDRHSSPLVLFATRKVRQPRMFAVNTVKVSIPLHQIQEGVDCLLSYLQGIGYQGMFGAEFKRDPRDGQLKLLEINARTQGGNYIATQCGANDVLAAYQDSLGRPVTPVTHYATGVYAIDLAIDAVMLLHRLVTGRFTAQDVTPYRHPHHYVRFHPQDPLPFLKGVQTYLRTTLQTV